MGERCERGGVGEKVAGEGERGWKDGAERRGGWNGATELLNEAVEAAPKVNGREVEAA